MRIHSNGNKYIGHYVNNVRNGNGNGQCPHDPLTVYEAIYGGNDSYVIYLPGTLIIHEWAAYSTFVPHQDGKHLLGFDTRNVDKFLVKNGAQMLNIGAKIVTFAG